MKVCLVGSSGGHLTHLYMLKPFWKNKDRFWVTFDKEDARSLLEGEKMYPCYYPTNRSLKALIKNTKIAWKVLHKEKPDLIISCGAAVAVPFFYIGKLMGAKLIYIEVFDRIDKPTMTGKMVYPITDKFVVQWEEQKKVYPKAINLGSIFKKGGEKMIFVTVGTHEQPFNRLVQKMDELKKNGTIQEDVIIQTGFSTYEPQYCQWSKLIPYQQMIKNVEEARIVITHGGPASFIMPLQIGKTPIVVPRQHKFGEHVNNHQVEFARNVEKRMGTIIDVEDVETLGDIITNYYQIVAGMGHGMSSNNAKFNEELEKLVDKLF